MIPCVNQIIVSHQRISLLARTRTTLLGSSVLSRIISLYVVLSRETCVVSQSVSVHNKLFLSFLLSAGGEGNGGGPGGSEI